MGKHAKTHSPEHCRKISEALKGRIWDHPQTDKARKLISEKAKKRWAKPGYRSLLSKRMSAGAKRRWAGSAQRAKLIATRQDPAVIARGVAAFRLTVGKKSAAKFGIPYEVWKKMTKLEKQKLSKQQMIIRKGFVPCYVKAAKRLGVDADAYGRLSRVDRCRVKAVLEGLKSHAAKQVRLQTELSSLLGSTT
jgi:hypothetical protein